MNNEIREAFQKNNQTLGALEVLVGDFFLDNLDISVFKSFFIMPYYCGMPDGKRIIYTAKLQCGINLDVHNMSASLLGKQLAEKLMTDYKDKSVGLFKIGVKRGLNGFPERGWGLFLRMDFRDE